MFDLFHTLARDFDLPRRRRPGLLDERVQHHDAAADQRAEEDPSDPFGAFQAQLEQTIAERVRVWRTEIRAHSGHPAGEDHVASGQRIGQPKDLLLDFFAVVLNCVVHGGSITNMLFARQRFTEGGDFGNLTSG